AGAVEAKIDNGVFCVPDLLVAGLDPLITNVMSVRAWNADDLTETFAANNLPVNFTDEVTVFAKQCIWAHYAYSGLTGPDVLVNGVNINNPRENAWYFRPTVVPVPADLGITKVSLSCPTPADWHNIDASNQYGPNGIHPAQPVSVRNEYLQHPQFNFPNTTQHSQKVNLGKLIAMLIGETATGSNIAGPIVEVGEGPVSVADLTIDGGVRASKILLGFHDKQEWYDNGGYQTVQVQFS
ncbi:MAG: hypothetical protein NXI22_11990, partial [bacterium]|nr:hypothetical protein [bacterium]